MAGLQLSIREEVLKREIPWETYMTAKMIQGTDLMLLRRYDHRPAEVQAQLLNQDGPAYFKTFLAVLKNVSKEETTEYALTLLDEALQANPSRAALFHDKSLAGDDIYGPFLRCLTRRNWYILERATRILALIVTSRPRGASPAPNGTASNGASTSASATGSPVSLESVVSPLIDFLCSQLKSPSHPIRSVPTAISALAALLRERSYRPLLVKADGVKLLAPHIVPPSGQQHVQLVYEAVLAVWLLTFYEPGQPAIRSARIIPKLIEVAKSGAKEKVVRVAVLSLKNLFDKYGSDMIEHGLLKVVVILQLQSWSDEDLKAALQSLEESVKSNIKVLSSFEQYKAEVLSGNLDWTPMHKDASFWRENIGKFEESDFQVLRVLITLLESSNDPRTLAVACHDLGQFITYHPAGRGVALDLKAKEKVMGRMTHPDPAVQKEALLCIQKLLLSSKYTSYLQT